MNEKVTLNRKEQKRLKVFNEVIAGHMTGKQAAATPNSARRLPVSSYHSFFIDRTGSRER
jgi:hypothetical protein